MHRICSIINIYLANKNVDFKMRSIVVVVAGTKILIAIYSSNSSGSGFFQSSRETTDGLLAVECSRLVALLFLEE